MWIVYLALRRPYTFVILALLIAGLGAIEIATMPTDIFPNINIPVVSVIWSYNGMAPEDMSDRILLVSQRAMTTTVNDIEHLEATAYNGVGLIRIYFQPSVQIDMALAQVSSVNQTILKSLPPGIFPPLVIKYDASSVPILQLSLASQTLTEQQLNDYASNFVRVRLITVPGAAIPPPYGGKTRSVMVDLDPNALYANQLSAADISSALNMQNLILPSGTVKMGRREYLVQLNSSPDLAASINNMPVKTVRGNTVFFRDVAHVRDGYNVQTNIVRDDGSRSVLLTVLKNGASSTLSIVDGIKTLIPEIQSTLPASLKIAPLFDQSIFVRSAVFDVLREGTIAAGLTALMVLLFLGSWRSTLIVCTSIPLSILTSIIILGLMGQTINVMTLGGLALAVGILVDDATVEIENVHRNMGMPGKSITRAILDGAQQIAIPAFVSTLSICIVFVPVLLLGGVAKFLFTPLAFAVIFAMLMSYLLTRTLVPTMVHFLLPVEIPLYQQGHGVSPIAKSLIWRVHESFENKFERFRSAYRALLVQVLASRLVTAIAFGVFVLSSLSLAWVVGRDFFPFVDAGQLRLHVRCPSGMRIEETEQKFAAIEREIRDILPRGKIDSILDNIGLPVSGINLAFSDTATLGPYDGEILISLTADQHGKSLEYMRRLRKELSARFPEEIFFFQAANITNQILDFGLPAAIDVQVTGNNLEANYPVAQELRKRIAALPGAADVYLHQDMDYPTVRVNVDRAKADQAGLSQQDVASSLLISLSASGQIAPNEWLNPKTGVNYQVNVQTPQYRIRSLDTLGTTPITARTGGDVQLLDNLASVERKVTPSIISDYNIQHVFDVYASADRRDLGSFAGDIQEVMNEVRPKLPCGSNLIMRGQVSTMQSSFVRLGLGMIFAILLVYVLMVVNFQSWVDPFIILTALPGAMAGILWMLFVTRTTLNVPSLMGMLMTVGVATANSILLVTFANEARAEGKNALEAALEAGWTRLRPVCMTALAMTIGMLPMALGLGDGGEQNAPLGRAVIGGLLVATPTTLFFVPLMYTVLRRAAPVDWDGKIKAEWGAPSERTQERHD